MIILFSYKVSTPGTAICTLCKNKTILYGNRGLIALTDHIVTAGHLKNYVLEKSNHSLPNVPAKSHHPYGINPEFRSYTKETPLPTPNVPVTDRALNQEALVLSYCAEKNLSFARAGEIIDIAKELSKDTKALNRTQLSRTTASYKMKYGLGKCIEDKTVSNLKETYFSLNIDEATSDTLQKVLTTLVSYFCEENKQVIVRHLTSLNVPSVTTNDIYNALVSFFDEKNIPWQHCLASLMDSCNVMRGSKNGLEKKLRETVCPNLLDIDGDSCHHIHNGCKMFTEVFGKHLDYLFQSVYNDFKWSEDHRNILKDICFQLGLTYRRPEMYSPTRWLKIHDIAIQTGYIFDALAEFYFPFLNTNDKTLYQSRINNIEKRRSVSAQRVQSIKENLGPLKRKRLTKAGKKRKAVIIKRLFYKKKMTLLQLSFFSSALIPLKEYVMLFQQAKPSIHKLYDKQFKVLREFLGYFIKPEVLVQYNTPKKLKELDCSKSEYHLRKELIFIGSKGETIRRKSRKNDATIESFLRKAIDAYGQCGNYLLKKLPITNHLLHCLSSIDPLAIVSRSETALSLLLKLSSYVTPVVLKTESDVSEYDKECRRIMIDLNLPAFDEEKDRADVWWYQLKERYPILCKVALALLTIFHGPRVESSFSTMGNILDKQSGRMNVDTYSAIQSVKYNVIDNPESKNGVKSISTFKRKDKLHTPIVFNLCHNMRNARGRYKVKLKEMTKENRKKISTLGAVKNDQLTKKDVIKKNVKQNKSTKFDLILRDSMTNSNKIKNPNDETTGTLTANSTSATILASSTISTSTANSNSTTPVSSGANVMSTTPQGSKRKLKQVDLSSFFKKQKL